MKLKKLYCKALRLKRRIRHPYCAAVIVFRNAQNILKSYIFVRFQKHHITQQARGDMLRACIVYSIS